MDKFTILAFIISIFSCIAVIYSMLIWRYKRKIYLRNKEINNKKVVLDFQREQIENSIYADTDELTSESSRFYDVNGLWLYNNGHDNALDDSVPNFSFFKQLGIEFPDNDIQDNVVVCLMPFHKNFVKVFNQIRQTCKESGFVCVRSDDEYISGNILRHIIQIIIKAKVVVAVIDGRNPNVMYEVGIAHAIGKKVILVAQKNRLDNAPFDLASNGIILYNNPGELDAQLKDALNLMKK